MISDVESAPPYIFIEVASEFQASHGSTMPLIDFFCLEDIFLALPHYLSVTMNRVAQTSELMANKWPWTRAPSKPSVLFSILGSHSFKTCF